MSKQWSAARLDVNRKVENETISLLKPKYEGKRGDYINLEEGNNYIRILPPHDENEPSLYPYSFYWMECLVTDKDGNQERKVKQIFNASVHGEKINGNTQKDVVDEFVKYIRKGLWNIPNEDERNKKKASLFGWRGKDGKWNKGILSGLLVNTEYVCYATKGDIIPENIGRLRLWKQHKEKLEEINASLSTEFDVLSCPNNGVQLVFTKTKNSLGNIETFISKREFVRQPNMSAQQTGEAMIAFENSQKVPQDVLDKLEEMDSLSSQFKNQYKKSDFEYALEALQYLDNNKLHFGIFGYDSPFLEVVDEIRSYFKETGEKHIDEMNGDELIEYITTQGLPIVPKRSWSDDDIRDAIKAVESGNDTLNEDDLPPSDIMPEFPKVNIQEEEENESNNSDLPF